MEFEEILDMINDIRAELHLKREDECDFKTGFNAGLRRFALVLKEKIMKENK